MHRIFNVQRKEETKNLVWCWLQCQGSVKHLTSISYNAGKITVQCFLSVEEFKPLFPSRMSLFRLWDLKFSVIWGQYSSQSLNGHLPTTDSKRTKEGVSALSPFPGRFPEKIGGAGNALLRYLYLTFYIGSHFSITDTKGVQDTRSWLQCFSRTPRASSGLTHFPAHYHISSCAESVYSFTISQMLPFIQWLPLPLTLLKTPLFRW